MAKRIIKLIHSVADVVNNDNEIAGRLRVAFVPDYNVKHSARIFPGADLSEQISLAGKEASGTGNMKFAMNGALTIGTLDGANIEIREAVGAENFFLFGMTVEDVERRLAQGYRPYDHYQSDEELRAAIDAIADGAFSNGDRELFKPIVENLLGSDPYMLLGGLPLVCRLPGRGRPRVARPRALDARLDPQRGTHGPVLVGSLDPRLLPRHLARRAGADSGLESARRQCGMRL